MNFVARWRRKSRREEKLWFRLIWALPYPKEPMRVLVKDPTPYIFVALFQLYFVWIFFIHIFGVLFGSASIGVGVEAFDWRRRGSDRCWLQRPCGRDTVQPLRCRLRSERRRQDCATDHREDRHSGGCGSRGFGRHCPRQWRVWLYRRLDQNLFRLLVFGAVLLLPLYGMGLRRYLGWFSFV